MISNYATFVFKSTNLLNKQKIIVSIIDDSNLAGIADFIVEIYNILGVARIKFIEREIFVQRA